jgi:hypothetical protein
MGRIIFAFLCSVPIWATTPQLDVKTEFYDTTGCGGVGCQTVTCTLTSVTAGDAVVFAFTSLIGNTVSSVSDSHNTYTRAAFLASGAGTRILYVYTAPNVTSGTLNIVATLTNTGDFPACIALAYKNAATSSIVDGTPSKATNTTGAPDPGSFSTSNANDAIIGFAYTSTGVVTQATGYTLEETAGNGGTVQLNGEDQIVASTGSYDPNWTTTLAPVWVAIGLAIKGTPSAPSCATFMMMQGAGCK